MAKEQTVTGLLQEIADEFCNRYCKYPEKYEDEDKLYEERCENCHLTKI